MNKSEFYDTIKLLSKQKSGVALININEFKRLKRINGEYKWIPFTIGKLPAIPIETSEVKEIFRETDELLSIKITPIWKYLTNGEKVITPKIEMLEITEHNKFERRYTSIRKKNSDLRYYNIFDRALTQRKKVFELKERKYYTLTCRNIPNHHYLTNSNWHDIFDKTLAQRENAVEWDKQSKSTLLRGVDEQTLQIFLSIYQNELQEFNALYEESADTAKALNKYQKTLK